MIKDPFVLLIITCGDIINFTMSLYSKNLKEETENSFTKLTDLRNLDKNSFKIFKKMLRPYKNVLVDTKKLIQDLREEFEVNSTYPFFLLSLEHLRNIIYNAGENQRSKDVLFNSQPIHHSDENLSKDFSLRKNKKALHECTSFYIIGQFNLLKKFIIYNSIPFETPYAKKVPKDCKQGMEIPIITCEKYRLEHSLEIFSKTDR